MDDSRLRPATVASSVGPQASKNCTSCLRAPSSFHLRSRRTISIKMVDRVLAAALGVERQRKVEARLMVERIGRDLLLELGRADRAIGLLGKLERRAGGGDRRLIALGFGNHGQRLLGLVDRAGLHIGARQPGQRRDVGAVLGEKLRVHLGCAGGVALGERRVGRLEQSLLLAADAVLGEPLEEGDHLALRQRAEEAVGRLAVDEGDHRRDRLDAELARDRRMLVDVHLDQLHLALGGLHHLLDDRA